MSTDNIIPQGSLQSTNIAFVDSNVAQADELLTSLQTDKVFLLNDQSSGLDQITQVLAAYSNLESVHIFSHGSQGQLQLGNSIFSQTNLNDYEAELESWKTAFSQEGDLLFYGCNLAAADGFGFIEQISQLTQADVAASDNITGHTGDWQLEKATGSIEAGIAVSQATQVSYQGQLNLILGTAGNDGVLEGTAGDDTLNGLGGIDQLQGNDGADLFILGDDTGGFYDQEFFSDYVDILDFTSGEDTIQLSGVLGDYSFQAVGNSTWIYKGDISNAELVADVFNTGGADITSSIDFVGGGTPPPPPPPPTPTPGNDIVGTPGNDGILEGTTGDDTLNGLGGIDQLQGNSGADLFILGDEAGGFYDQNFFNDYADILDFSIGEDTIQLNGTIDDYSFQTVGTSTWIYKGDISNAELVADVFNTDGTDITGSIEFLGDGPNPPVAGQFAFSATEYTVDEQTSSMQIRVDRLGGTDGVVSVDYATVDGTTTQLEDYVPVVGKLTFGDGQASMLITIPIIQDPYAESDETFNIRLSNPTGGATIETAETTVTIVDDDTQAPAGLLRFGRPMYMTTEGNPSVAVTVLRDGGANGEITVDYFTDDDGATAGQDYTAVSGKLTFADGETEKTIVVPILEDQTVEDDERFWLYLDNPTGGASTVVSGAQLIIMDNEPRPGSGNGLYGEYYNNLNFTDLTRVSIDENIAFDFGNSGPAGIAPDTFSIRWTGEVETLYSEEYVFQTTSDDGIRLWVNDQLLINNWTDHGPTVDTGSIVLEAGQRYDIRVDYYENGGNATVDLKWSSDSQELELIPRSQLYSNSRFERGDSEYLLTPTQMTWQEAQQYAQRLGGNLVTINDAAEEDWLQSRFGKDERFWTGLNDVKSEGSFVWASGADVTYTNFAPGEPNNSGGNQDFVTMNFGANDQWDDDGLNSAYFGIIEVTGDNLPSQNAIFGNWSGVIGMPNIAVAAAQLPDGEIVTWSSWDRFKFGGNNPRTFTSVFNTASREVEEFLITNTQHDMFCPGTVMLPDGRIMVNGGGSTVTSTSIYDFKTDTWTRVENMNMRRWYNTSLTLDDGSVLTWGGNAPDSHAGNAEIWREGEGWTTVDGMNINIYQGTGDQTSWHPQMFQAPNGKVFIAGPGPEMYWADLDDVGSVLESAGQRPDGYSQHGSFVMYDVGKILKFGGADREANSGTVTNKAYIIDITGDTPIVTETGEMNYDRKFLNGVVLPDGRVMAVGGNTSGKKFSDEGTVYAGEVWDPSTGEWSVMDSMDIPRNYHSVALLQSDGTVFAAGGGLTGGGAADHPDAQVFSPGYLFNDDGSLADRPDIATVDKADYGDTINLEVTDDQDIVRFNLIRMSTVTHSINTDQRLISLEFSDLGNDEYALQMPESGYIAPPGYYMLYALNADGTPSEAAVINLR
ncbi:DUF4347 domain-containing protein [Leptothoe spongobia]|uniref:DUF4347 domain-containing protein n=1 Tax=Leptothoe spongobia TAU-MAC 1115 TaxID=1967444 RepID=A0A947DEK0_9CYAN|nr:DUF4347 domain-containing protein [Leptothoe spongobia]MBT9315667.1 DUF4347 domain-containing protein [Leptothoe spongobia TAU-MAC 1115]